MPELVVAERGVERGRPASLPAARRRPRHRPRLLPGLGHVDDLARRGHVVDPPELDPLDMAHDGGTHARQSPTNHTSKTAVAAKEERNSGRTEPSGTHDPHHADHSRPGLPRTPVLHPGRDDDRPVSRWAGGSAGPSAAPSAAAASPSRCTSVIPLWNTPNGSVVRWRSADSSATALRCDRQISSTLSGSSARSSTHQPASAPSSIAMNLSPCVGEGRVTHPLATPARAPYALSRRRLQSSGWMVQRLRPDESRTRRYAVPDLFSGAIPNSLRVQHPSSVAVSAERLLRSCGRLAGKPGSRSRGYFGTSRGRCRLLDPSSASSASVSAAALERLESGPRPRDRPRLHARTRPDL